MEPDEEAQLLGIIGKHDVELNLLYSAASDGWKVATFHQKCDHKGPTMTIASNSGGYVFGAYTEKEWGSGPGWLKDEQAFLFRLKKGNVFSPAYYKGKALYINCDPSSGPSFGCPGDLQKNQRSQHVQGGGFVFGSTTDRQGHQRNSQISSDPFGGSQAVPQQCSEMGLFFLHHDNSDCSCHSLNVPFDMEGHSEANVTGNLEQVDELRVFAVGKKLNYSIQKPWRKVVAAWEEKVHCSLKDWVTDYKPADKTGVPHTNIVMFGLTGSGKSSFFNTISSVYRGHVTSQAVVGRSLHSLTTKHRKYAIRASGTTLNFRLWDTIGMEERFGLELHEFMYVLDGNIPDYFQFNPMAPATPDTEGFIREPTLAHRAHVVVYVLSATRVEKIPEKIQDKVQAIHSQVNRRNLPLLVLLTNVDRVCSRVADDTSCVFSSSVVLAVVERAAELIGVPRAHVLPVRNYESESELDQNTDILALTALRQMLRFADSYLEDRVVEGRPQRESSGESPAHCKKENLLQEY